MLLLLGTSGTSDAPKLYLLNFLPNDVNQLIVNYPEVPIPCMFTCFVCHLGLFLTHFDPAHPHMSDAHPAFPARSLRKVSFACVLHLYTVTWLAGRSSSARPISNSGWTWLCLDPQSPLHPIPASPTILHSGLDGSNSTLSGSASSGVSSLSESQCAPPSEPPGRTDTLESIPSQAWTPDEVTGSPYLYVHYSTSEPDDIHSTKPLPCRSHSAPGGVNSGPPQDHLYYQNNAHLCHGHHPTLTSKPYFREVCRPEEGFRQQPMLLPAPLQHKIP